MRARYAVFGDPVGHSRSPEIYAAFARQSGHDFEFELVECPPAGFADAVRAFAGRGGRGANVTLPHKHAALELVGHASDRARNAGAVNVLRIEEDGSWYGDNTDGPGLLADLERNHGLELRGARILVVGAGGAAHGIVPSLLAAAPAELVVANRDPARAGSLAARFAADGPVRAAPLDTPGAAFDLVVNATACSLQDTVPDVPAAVLAPGGAAYDLAYGRDGTTAFTHWAHAHGAGTVADGWGMLVEQAAVTYEVWFGVRPDTTALQR